MKLNFSYHAESEKVVNIYLIDFEYPSSTNPKVRAVRQFCLFKRFEVALVALKIVFQVRPLRTNPSFFYSLIHDFMVTYMDIISWLIIGRTTSGVTELRRRMGFDPPRVE